MTNLMIKILSRIGFAFALLAGTFAAATPLIVSATPTPVTVLTAGTKQQFAATESGGGVPVVFWSVSGTGCSGFGCGHISVTSGLYTAPATLSSPISVTITATSINDYSTTGSATITVSPAGGGGGGITVSIAPPTSLQLNVGGTETFSATVTGSSNTAVNWSAGGAGCAGNCGTITSGGFYTAPASVSGTVSVVITATSQANTSASSSVTIQVGPIVGITISAFNAQMTPGTQQQFSATVTGSSITTVRWSVSCTSSSCGTISSSGLYAAPNTKSSVSVTVKATAQADLTKSAFANIVVAPGATISVTPSGLSLSVNAQQEYTASVTGASNSTVTWSVSGAGCSGAACGMVSSLSSTTALYQAPSSVPSPATVSITAALSSSPTTSSSATATIVPPSNSRLTGQFAFLFRGFDATGSYQAAGSFTADGNGNLQNGIEDINCGAGAHDSICASGPVSGQTFTGTYTINADGRGTFAITPTAGSPTYTFALAMNSANTKARFIESDSNGIRGSGVLELQTPSAFASSAINGGFAFNLSGVDSAGQPIAAIGNMVLFVSGFTGIPGISAGVMDVNDNGTVSCFPPEIVNTTACLSSGVAYQRATGVYSVGPNGRGTASFSIQGFDGNSADISTFNFGMYVISPGEFFLVSMDDPGLTNNPVFSGQALEVTTAAATALQQGPAVLSWSGWSAVPSGSAPGTLGLPQAGVGQFSMDNLGNITNLYYDVNQNGVTSFGNYQSTCYTVNKKGQKIPNGLCTYAVQPNLDFVLSAGNPNPTQFRAFPISANTGFVLGTGSSVTVGKIESQSAAFPFSFMFGSDLMTSSSASLLSGTGSLTEAWVLQGALNGNQDDSFPSMFIPGQPFVGKYGPAALPNGHGFLYLHAPGVPTLDFWVVTVYKMVAIEVEPGDVPNLIIFEN